MTPLGGNLYKLEWTGSVPNNVTVPTGGQISLTLTDYDSTYSFNVLYDSKTNPSQVQVSTATAITVDSVGVYGSPYPGGSPLTRGLGPSFVVEDEPYFIELQDPESTQVLLTADYGPGATSPTIGSTSKSCARVAAT